MPWIKEVPAVLESFFPGQVILFLDEKLICNRKMVMLWQQCYLEM